MILLANTTIGMLVARPRKRRRNPRLPRLRPKHIVEAHHKVRHEDGDNGLTEAVHLLYTFIFRLRQKELEGNPEDKEAAGEFHEGYFKELGSHKGEADSEYYCSCSAEYNAPLSLFFGRVRTAMAMTTALSPERIILINMMLRSPKKKTPVNM